MTSLQLQPTCQKVLRFRTKTTGVFGVQQSALQRTRAYIDSMLISRFLSLRMGRPSFSGWKDTYPTYPFSLNSHFFGPKEKITPNHISKNKKHQHFVKQTYCNFRTPIALRFTYWLSEGDSITKYIWAAIFQDRWFMQFKAISNH